jgi:hypothetical protein
MRLPVFLVLTACLLAGCNKADEAPASADGIKIKTEKTAPPPLPETRGKLAVLPQGVSAEPVVSPNAPPPQPDLEPIASAEPLPPPQPAVRSPMDEDEALMRDCMGAEAEGHPFGASPTCRAMLGR